MEFMDIYSVAITGIFLLLLISTLISTNRHKNDLRKRLLGHR